MKSRAWSILVFSATAALMLSIGILMVYNDDSDPICYDNFASIKPGMTLAAVEELLGCPAGNYTLNKRSPLSFSRDHDEKLEILGVFRGLMSSQQSHHPKHGGISSERQGTTNAGLPQACDFAASGQNGCRRLFAAHAHGQQHSL
jgi:hypothetical protein